MLLFVPPPFWLNFLNYNNSQLNNRNELGKSTDFVDWNENETSFGQKSGIGQIAVNSKKPHFNHIDLA